MIWKGHVSFGLVNIPVALHPAEVREELDFTLLDKKDLSPVGYRGDHQGGTGEAEAGRGHRSHGAPQAKHGKAPSRRENTAIGLTQNPRLAPDATEGDLT